MTEQSLPFRNIRCADPSDLAAVYQDLVRCGELAAWESPDRFYEIGSLEGIADLTEFLSR